MSPTHQDLSNDTMFSQIKSRVPVPLRPFIAHHKILILLETHRNLMINLLRLHLFLATLCIPLPPPSPPSTNPPFQHFDRLPVVLIPTH